VDRTFGPIIAQRIHTRSGIPNIGTLSFCLRLVLSDYRPWGREHAHTAGAGMAIRRGEFLIVIGDNRHGSLIKIGLEALNIR
jgi:hypothetical protein